MFQISPLPADRFAHLFGQSDDWLEARGVMPRIAGEASLMPCRITLRDARPGERVLLLNYEHQDAATPYQSRYAIYVIDGAEEARLAPGDLPPVFAGRPLAVRAFSSEGMLLDAGLVPAGGDAPALIERLFSNPDVAYLHVHNAMHGCYAARVDRA